MDKVDWKVEFKKQLDQISDPHELEQLGKELSVEQFIIVLQLMEDKETIHNEKLIPILAGLPSHIFFQALPNLPLQSFTALQHESVSVPIQRHLTVLCDEKFTMLDQLAVLVLTLETLIESIHLENLELKDKKDIEGKIGFLESAVEQEIALLNKALSLAWNSDRIDLIEKLSLLKETLQKYKIHAIGTPKQQIGETLIPATGLYAKLDNKLNTVYPEASIPVLEALTKLSIWYIKDYYEVGLLPEIESEELLDLNPETHSEKERGEYRDQLMIQVKNCLKRLNLITVEDLKNAHIYSKKALKEYTKGGIS